MKKYIPDMYKKSVFEINYKKLKSKGIKCILFDLDDTLAAYNEDNASSDIKELFLMLSNDFKVGIISNASKKRLTPFKEALNVDTAYRSWKPSQKKYNKFKELYRLKPEQFAIVGDQLLTDIKGANIFGAYSILVNPVGTYCPFTTKFNRFFEKRIFKKLKDNSILERGKYYE